MYVQLDENEERFSTNKKKFKIRRVTVRPWKSHRQLGAASRSRLQNNNVVADQCAREINANRKTFVPKRQVLGQFA